MKNLLLFFQELWTNQKGFCSTHPEILVVGAEAAEHAGGQPGLGGDVRLALGGGHQRPGQRGPVL